MRHEITQAEATAIRKAQAEQARRVQQEREKRELDEWLSQQELKAKTQ